MKALTIIAALTLTLGAALGQAYSPQTILNGSTHGVGAASTTNYSASQFSMDVRKQEVIPLLFSFACTATNAGTVLLTFERSLDNTTYDGTHTFTWEVTANGTSTVSLCTNFTLSGFGWVRLKSIDNTNDVAGTTNMVLKYGINQAN